MNGKRRFLLLILLSLSLLFVILPGIWLFFSPPATRVSPPLYEEETSKASRSPDDRACYKIHRPSTGRSLRKRDPRPAVAIIIDDLGYDRDLALSFVRLNPGLSLSILPSAPFTRILVSEATRMRGEIILHQPMEPKGYPAVNPGPGALLLSMDKGELLRILDRNLREIEGARGVNNHMGSAFTENREKMGIVLEELKKRGLFYLDSRTTTGTVGLEQARKIGLPAAERSVFLDNVPQIGSIRIQIDRLLDIAGNRGSAIGIGHPHHETLVTLRDYLLRLTIGFRLVPVSELVQQHRKNFFRGLQKKD